MQQFSEKQAFLDTVCKNVRWKQAHEVISRDLSDHIDDQTAAFVAQGVPAEEACARAVAEMGDPVAAGLALDASYRPNRQTDMLCILGALVMVGLFCRLLLYDMSALEWMKFLAALLIGSGCFFALFRLNLYRLTKWAGPVYIAAIALTVIGRLAIRFDFSPDTNYLRYFFVFIPALFAGAAYSMRGKGIWGLIIIGASLAVPLLVLVTFPDFSQIALLTITCLMVIAVASFYGVFGKHKWLPVIISLAAVIAALGIGILSYPYSLQRFEMRLHPELYAESEGWMAMQIRELLACARPIGRGIETAAAQRWGLTPGQNISLDMCNDFLLTVVTYRFGWLPALLLTLLLFVFIGFGLYRALKLKSIFGKLIAVAVIGTFTMQSIAYLTANLGFILGAALPLPFIAYGSISLIVDLALSGLLVSLFYTDGLYADRSADRAKRLRIKLVWE